MGIYRHSLLENRIQIRELANHILINGKRFFDLLTAAATAGFSASFGQNRTDEKLVKFENVEAQKIREFREMFAYRRSLQMKSGQFPCIELRFLGRHSVL